VESGLREKRVPGQASEPRSKVVVVCSIVFELFVLKMMIITTRLKKEDQKMRYSLTKYLKNQKFKNFLVFIRTYFDIVFSTPGPKRLGPAHL
jgi:hypothetical protein